MSSSLYDQILNLEESTWIALQTSGAALVPYLTKDAIMQFPMGLKVTSKTEPSVQDILHSPAFVPWKRFKLRKVDVTPVGPDGAVISYQATATRASADPKDTRDAEFDALCCSVWRKEGGSWMMCFHQQTMAGEGLSIIIAERSHPADKMAQAPATTTTGQEPRLRSLSIELAALAADCASRPEEWVRSRLEEFHARIEKRYVSVWEENDRLQEKNRQLKEENERLHQERIDTLLSRNHDPDYGLSLEQQQNLAQNNIDRILSQSTGMVTRAPPGPAAPRAHHQAASSGHMIKVEPAAWPPNPYPMSAGLGVPNYLPPYSYTSSIAQPSPIPRLESYAQQSKRETKPPPTKRQRIGPRPTPKCSLCFIEDRVCDGKPRCQACHSRQDAYCNYEDCVYGDECPYDDCTRLHPEQKAFQNRPYSV
ncbi:hypothetical protein CKM354_000976200 [Cercospora kikuchii]|uniref:DUF4440 domain-containing protein n=2 Tax=Cercospora TaxID=29002 RepID=A0A9P3CPS2_9PEZI|nr:uncharacterized protein CKM354_000976200 [Cercospora kikuchii]GIZ46643.1 hypothetical protein CKM354_000976200 [Cercospora kikuchii]